LNAPSGIPAAGEGGAGTFQGTPQAHEAHVQQWLTPRLLSSEIFLTARNPQRRGDVDAKVGKHVCSRKVGVPFENVIDYFKYHLMDCWKRPVEECVSAEVPWFHYLHATDRLVVADVKLRCSLYARSRFS
jgi:hypothetical protein